MAKVRLNPVFDSLHGRIGKIVHYRRYGDQCARSHVIPRNPDTPAQRKQENLCRGRKGMAGTSPGRKVRV